MLDTWPFCFWCSPMTWLNRAMFQAITMLSIPQMLLFSWSYLKKKGKSFLKWKFATKSFFHLFVSTSIYWPVTRNPLKSVARTTCDNERYKWLRCSVSCWRVSVLAKSFLSSSAASSSSSVKFLYKRTCETTVCDRRNISIRWCVSESLIRIYTVPWWMAQSILLIHGPIVPENLSR